MSLQTETLLSRTKRIRQTIIKMSHQAQSAHVGSALSAVEILAALFERKYGNTKTVDRIIMSKGHAAMALYATAAEFKQFDATLLDQYLKDDSAFWGHPSRDTNFPFIEWSTGSLGHGLPVVIGQAYADLKILGRSKGLKAVLLSDGECNEGSNWEAILFAGHHQLTNVLAIVDYNRIQSFGRCEEVMRLEPFAEKWRAFGWSVIETDGHDLLNLIAKIDEATQSKKDPTCIIAKTIKGKGVPEIEDKLESHYKPINESQYRASLK